MAQADRRTNAREWSVSAVLKSVNGHTVSSLITFLVTKAGQMRSETPLPSSEGTKPPVKLMLWLTLICALMGQLGTGEIFEDQLRVLRNRLHVTSPSGEIVIVGIDDRSTRALGAWPWPRARMAQLLDRVSQSGAKSVFLNVPLTDRTTAIDDQALAQALGRAPKPFVPVQTREGNYNGEVKVAEPQALFASRVRQADASVFYNYQQAVWRVPFGTSATHPPLPSVAALLSDRPVAKPDGEFRVDYSIDATRIPQVSAADLLGGSGAASKLANKTVVISPVGASMGDQTWIPGRGRMTSVLVPVLAAETLKRGTPVDLGFLPALVLAVGLCAWSLTRQTRRGQDVPLACGALVLLVLPVLIESEGIFVDVFAGLAALLWVGVRLAWRRWRSGGLVNAQSGLPNLTALREVSGMSSKLLAAARVHNYAEIASTLSGQGESELVRQIVSRLAVADQPMTVYQGDEGIFAWFAEPGPALTNHLEALHALFRAPVSIDARSVDVALTFGVELGSNRGNASRLGSALVAADEAWQEGLRWKYHDPSREEEASWRLSLLGELDAAIDRGEVWIAYQPQVDLKTNRVVGAEALARWTHPDKGPISPAEFVAAAEQQGRIAKLTDFVLDRAISTAAAVNRRGQPFSIAVNISPRLLSDHGLVQRIKERLVVHQLAPERLTLELTETESLQNADDGLAILEALRRLGVRIAIDDYGTGLSTLDYLKKVPASEIKIDQSFVRAMKHNRSDLIMVQSTIALAHSLGRTVVAEGVEDRATFDQLLELQCDVVQGYLVGRPMGVRELVQSLQIRHTRQVA